MISKEIRTSIKGYLEGFIDGLVEQHKPKDRPSQLILEEIADYETDASDGGYKPFHEAIIPEQILRVSTFERSFSTKLALQRRFILLRHFEYYYDVLR
jgi:hypothetical protein